VVKLHLVKVIDDDDDDDDDNVVVFSVDDANPTDGEENANASTR